MKQPTPIPELIAHVNGFSSEDERIEFAAKCGITIGSMRQLMYGHANASADVALSIAEHTNWVVTPHQIRPQTFRNPHDGLPLNLFVQRAQMAV